MIEERKVTIKEQISKSSKDKRKSINKHNKRLKIKEFKYK